VLLFLVVHSCSFFLTDHSCSSEIYVFIHIPVDICSRFCDCYKYMTVILTMNVRFLIGIHD
jgi:hypothetical protein